MKPTAGTRRKARARAPKRARIISKFNALDHGGRAKTVVLPEEDPAAFQARQDAWSARFLPRDDPEAFILKDAVVNSWQLDRIRRAQTARLTANILDDGVDHELTIQKQVADLGRRLFKDRQGPLQFYPMHQSRIDTVRNSSTSYETKGKDPDYPAELVLCLQSTLQGCEWMLGEWAGLKAILDKGQPWLSSDKLKAVRLLGKQPFDALDVQDVAMVYLASFALKADKSTWDWEISKELAENDITRFREQAATRELPSLLPKDADQARERSGR